MTKILIKFLRFSRAHERAIAVAQLVQNTTDADEVLLQGSVGEILAYAEQHQLVIDNAQEILYTLVVKNGFAS